MPPPPLSIRDRGKKFGNPSSFRLQEDNSPPFRHSPAGSNRLYNFSPPLPHSRKKAKPFPFPLFGIKGLISNSFFFPPFFTDQGSKENLTLFPPPAPPSAARSLPPLFPLPPGGGQVSSGRHFPPRPFLFFHFRVRQSKCTRCFFLFPPLSSLPILLCSDTMIKLAGLIFFFPPFPDHPLNFRERHFLPFPLPLCSV